MVRGMVRERVREGERWKYMRKSRERKRDMEGVGEKDSKRDSER